jgi:Cu-processing system ATP-binding protein
VRPDAGTIRVLGETIGSNPHYRRFIGYMPQLPRFPDNLTGQEVLDLLSSLNPSRDASPLASRLSPLASAELLSRPVRTLSGGSRQKLNALVACRYDVPLLILDEPTASLDPVTSSHMKDLVRAQRDAGVATLLTSHVMAEVEELADRVVYLVEGRVRFSGSLDELRLATGERKVERAIARLMQEAA